jgi:prepilin-type N-terminal cleavage/methylation domain-containing protein
MLYPSRRKAFTLIELLIVIAIIAITSVIIVFILQPAEILKQGRDVNRVADFSTLRTAVGTYLIQGGSLLGTAATTYISVPDPLATTTAGDHCEGLGLASLPSGYSYHCAASSSYRANDGTGWMPVNFTVTSNGAPLEKLPIDPINQTSSGLYYAYITNGSQYEFTAAMESQKYKTGGSSDIVSSDGGQYSDLYEAGTNLALLPADRFANFNTTESANLAGTSRVFNTTYQNTSTNPIFVITFSGSSGGTAIMYTDSNSTPASAVSAESAQNTWARSIAGFVLPGNYYKQSYDVGNTLWGWLEFSLTGMSMTQSANLAGGSRVFNTTYQNTSSHPIFVAVESAANTGGSGSAWALSDTSSSPSALVSVQSNLNGYGRTLFFAVPAGNYYKTSYDTASTLYNWYEWTVSGFSITQSADLAGTSRVLRTAYQNTSTYPIFVSVVDSANSVNGSGWIMMDTHNPPTTFIDQQSGSAGWSRSYFIIVPPGSYYEMSYDSASTLQHWFEWRISGP